MLAPIVLCAVGSVSGCGTMLLSWDQEVQMGVEAAPQFTAQYGGMVRDGQAVGYVRQIGTSLTTAIGQSTPDLPWEFTLLDSDVINAFALPGGKVFVTRGLVQRLDNEAELAGVLGHEIGHVTARHANKRISAQIGINIVLAGLGAVVAASDEDSTARKVGQIGVPALAISGNLVMLKYGRDEELEADRLGMRYMARKGYDPRGQLQVMQMLEETSKAGSRQPELLSTHPYPERRIEQIRSLLQTKYADTQGNPAFHLFKDRFHRRMLQRLADRRPDGSRPIGVLALSDPTTWCAHCRAQAERGPHAN